MKATAEAELSDYASVSALARSASRFAVSVTAPQDCAFTERTTQQSSVIVAYADAVTGIEVAKAMSGQVENDLHAIVLLVTKRLVEFRTVIEVRAAMCDEESRVYRTFLNQCIPAPRAVCAPCLLPL